MSAVLHRKKVRDFPGKRAGKPLGFALPVYAEKAAVVRATAVSDYCSSFASRCMISLARWHSDTTLPRLSGSNDRV